MTSVVCLLALLLGCSGGDEAAAPPPPPTPPPTAAVEAAPAEDTAAQDLSAPEAPPAPAGLAALAASGHHGAAFAAAREALAASATDGAAWRALGRSALASGQGPALLAELDAGQAAGGQAASHHLLRSELALALGRPGPALEAAGLAALADADAGAGAQALAVLAGAGLPAEVSKAAAGSATPAQALLRLCAARDAAAAEPWLQAAAQVGGWRADVARGQALARLGLADSAHAAFEEATKDSDPRAVLAGGMGLAGLALSAGDAALAVQRAQAGAEAAAADGDPVGAAMALDLALRAGQGAMDLDGPLAAAEAAVVKANVASGGTLAPELALALGRAGILAGKPGAVLRPLWTATLGLPAEGHPQALALDTVAATAAFLAGQDEVVAALADEGGATPAAVLASAMAGSPGFAPDLAGLSDLDAALFGLVAVEVHVPAAERLAHLATTAAAADRAGIRSLSVQAWLAVDDAARLAGDAAAATAARAALARVVGTPAPAMAAELGARAALVGAAPPAMPDGVAGAWNALFSSAAPPAGVDPMSPGVVGWAAARALGAQAKGTEAAKAYLDALGQLPTHRAGRLSLGTVLDGSQGVPVAVELAMVSGLDVEAAPRVALAAHELLHRVRDVQRQVTAGRGLADGLPPALAFQAMGAAARARAETTRWLLGGAAPDLAPVAQAEQALAAAPAFARLLPTTGEAAVAIARDDAGTALISVVQAGDRLSAAVLSGRGFAIRDLGPASKLFASLRAHDEALRAHGQVSASGNAVRQALLDPFTEQLSGVPRFVLVGPPELQRFGIATVPEQDDALRWLEDIRDVTVAPTLSTLVRPETPTRAYRPDLLLLGPPVDEAAVAGGTAAEGAGAGAAEGAAKAAPPPGATATKAAELGPGEDPPLPAEIERGTYDGLAALPEESAVAVRTFSRGVRQLVMGPDALLANWEAGAPTARIVQISQVEASPGGGFRMADGNLELDRVRGLPMQADLVLITADAPTETQLQRAQAFLDAGARAVVISAWPSTTPDRERYVSELYDAMNQERPVIRAMEQARLAVRNDALRAETNTHPGVWGSWLLVGRP